MQERGPVEGVPEVAAGSPLTEGASPEPASRAGLTLRGTRVAPGLASGPLQRVEPGLPGTFASRVPLDRVEEELNRFHTALEESQRQLEDLKHSLAGRVPEDQARILDTHVAYLRDSVFVSDVENLILNEQLSLGAAIGKVVSDFDRIFHLVENETLRERAVDLRDVGLRVLRCLESEELEAPAIPVSDSILVARELSIVDMFTRGGEHVLGIVTEEGALTSHAAILARSMRIPTLTAVEGLLDAVEDGDLAILDATEGMLRVRPDESLLDQYREVAQQRRDREDAAPSDRASAGARTADGTTLQISAACGSLPELERAVGLGVPSIGLYRTELLFLVDRVPPGPEALRAHYSAVLGEADGRPVTFRLLSIDSGLEVPYLHEQREPNPALGRAGIRALLERDDVLRAQLRAILLARPGAPVRIAVPFVTDVSELRAVREMLFEERRALRTEGLEHDREAALGPVIETPAAALSAGALLRESDFAVIGLDSLSGYLLAADRQAPEVASWFDVLPPAGARVLRELVSAAEISEKPLSVFGGSLLLRGVLPFVVGAGLRDLCISPVGFDDLVAALGSIDLTAASRATEALEVAPSVEDAAVLLESLLPEPEE